MFSLPEYLTCQANILFCVSSTTSHLTDVGARMQTLAGLRIRRPVVWRGAIQKLQHQVRAPASFYQKVVENVNLTMSFSRFKNLIDGLKAEGNTSRQLESLNEVCEILCMGNEESLQGILTFLMSIEFVFSVLDMVACSTGSVCVDEASTITGPVS
jgi:hypothetical protein